MLRGVRYDHSVFYSLTNITLVRMIRINAGMGYIMHHLY